MKVFYFVRSCDPLFLGTFICAESIEAGTKDFIKLYGLTPCVCYELPSDPKLSSRSNAISNLIFLRFFSRKSLNKLSS